MKKLIELLQEYLNSEEFKKHVSGDDNIEDITDVKITRYFTDRFYCTYISDTETEIYDDTVISKRYGFIKWLVENDKIDTDAYKTVYSGDLDKRKTLTMSSGGDEFYQVTEHGVYESLLMLLSISSSPIEDLISYLK